MGDQFSSFLKAVYCLYEEKEGEHRLHRRLSWGKASVGSNHHSIRLVWDEEGSMIHITLSRLSEIQEPCPKGTPDPIHIELLYWGGSYQYTVDGRELCYAIAKGYTEAIKKYGFQGYLRSSGFQYLGDSFEMEELLFVKAYALDAMEARERAEAWHHPNGWMRAESSSFEKEMELFLFDM